MPEPTPSRLATLFGAYFHQDWDREAADWRGVIRNFVAEVGRREADAAADDIDQLLAGEPNDATLSREVYGAFGSYYDPRPDLGGPDLRTWLESVAACLRASTV